MEHKDLSILLETWEQTYKKGQLTLWVFMAIRNQERYVDEIKEFVETTSKGTMQCEEQSLYRLLRKFKATGVLHYHKRKGDKGPDRKYYYLTPLGEALFDAFVERNILLFQDQDILDTLKPKK